MTKPKAKGTATGTKKVASQKLVKLPRLSGDSEKEKAAKSIASDKAMLASRSGALTRDMLGPELSAQTPNVLPDEIARSLRTIKIAFESIVLDKDFNSRKDYRGIESLSQDIAEAGLISALVVYADPKKPGYYHLIAGFRRTLAILRLRDEARKAGAPLPFEEIEVKVYEGPELGRWILNLRENMSRVDLHAWEIGDQCVRIRERFQLSGAQIGERLSYQKSHVNNCMRIVERIAKDVQSEFRAGKAEPPFNFLITLAALNLADGKPDHERQRVKWQEYVGGKSGDSGAGGDGDDDADSQGGLKMRRAKEAEKCLAKLEDGLKEATREEERSYFRGAIGVARYMMGLTQKIKWVSFAKKK
jgi:ParB/RepB/Spo0J family partition protein